MQNRGMTLRTNFVLTTFVSSVISAFKLCQRCRRMATGVFKKLCHSQSVSQEHVDSQTGHRIKGGRSSALQNLVVHIKDSLPLGLNSMNH